MKKLTTLSLTLTVLFAPLFGAIADEYPPKGWVTDFPAAVEQAKEENKMILLNFTGSDWCGWCIRLDEEVFSQKEFEKFAQENLVRVFIDFPEEINQSDELKEQNQVLAQFFGARGFPTIWLLSSDLSPLLQTGYQAGGAESYIEHLKTSRPGEDNLSEEQINEFRTELNSLVSTLQE